jgi:hypothetical protein
VGEASIHALAIATAWNPSIAVPVAAAGTQELSQQGGVAFTPAAGSIDAALLGAGDAGLAGPIATVTFRAIADGDPGIAVRGLRARDRHNHPLALDADGRHAIAPPTETALALAAPNPFQDATMLGFSLAHRGPVTLEIFGVDGRRVRTLVHNVLEPGVYHFSWNGRSSDDARQGAGIYFVRFSADGRTRTRSVVLMGAR